MTLVQYLKDKRFFLGFYALLMLFVSFMLLTGNRPEQAASNILYANMVCLLLAGLYLGFGYYYRRSFYREMKDIIESESPENPAAMPDPRTGEQELYLELLGKLNHKQVERLQLLAHERKEHQDFIMSWIHEVKLPIAASRLIMENSPGKSAEALVDKLEDELGKIDHYVEQALYASRIDSFSKDYFITEVRLDQLMKESVKKYAKLFITKRIGFRMFEGVPYVQSDAKWLGYILDQITVNALKYTREGGSISIRFEEDEREKRLLIRDTGIGISSGELHRIFDRGFTGSNGRRKHAKSTGMGLYLARRLAVQLGHELSVASEEGVYTELTVHFPKYRTYYKL
jgi:signal transduction histidine kinase